jgi:IS5 family transposase
VWGFDCYAKTARRAAFLTEMERVVPWQVLTELIERSTPSWAMAAVSWVDWMLRIYFLQHWFNLSDPAVEEAL